MKRGSFMLIFFCLLFVSCQSSFDSIESNCNYVLRYCTEQELAQAQYPYSFFSDASEWRHQYPAGTSMKTSTITEDYKTKYFSLATDKGGIPYLHFSLDAADEGHSPNSKYVRTELSHNAEWTLLDKTSLSYTFNTNTTKPAVGYTVGQFLMHCTTKDSPLMRISVKDGAITAVVTDYESDGTTKARDNSNYLLSSYTYGTDVSIKIEVEAKKMKIYLNNVLKAEHTFHESVSSELTCYYKAGLYFQGTTGFAEVFLKDLSVTIN